MEIVTQFSRHSIKNIITAQDTRFNCIFDIVHPCMTYVSTIYLKTGAFVPKEMNRPNVLYLEAVAEHRQYVRKSLNTSNYLLIIS